MSHKKYRLEKNCLNCGEAVEQKFCPACGQENIEVRESFFNIIAHTIGDFFHFDSKFFKTFLPLLTRPGFLTQEYWEGRRVSYLHPLRLFFFITIIMVILANQYYQKFEDVIQKERIARTPPYGNSETAAEDQIMIQKVIEAVDSAFDSVSRQLKYISFFLLPVYALAFKILYWRKKRFYVDHLIYTLHLQSFVYISIILLLLFSVYIYPSSRDLMQTVLIICALFYMIFSLKKLHDQSWGKTILKTIVATLFMVVVTVFVVGGFMIVSYMSS